MFGRHIGIGRVCGYVVIIGLRLRETLLPCTRARTIRKISDEGKEFYHEV